MTDDQPLKDKSSTSWVVEHQPVGRRDGKKKKTTETPKINGFWNQKMPPRKGKGNTHPTNRASFWASMLIFGGVYT